MGNSQKQPLPDSNQRFHDDNLYKVVLKGHKGKVFDADIIRLKESNEILICTVSKDGQILLYKWNDKDILRYASQKKAKIIKNKSFVFETLSLNTSYNLTTALTYTHNDIDEFKHLFVANGGLGNMCIIHQCEIQQKTTQTYYRELEDADGYVATIEFIHDDSGRVIWGGGDRNVYISNFVKNEHLLTISVATRDVTNVAYYLTDDGKLIIGVSSVDCCIYIVTVDDRNHSKMKIINTQKIKASDTDINCISFSPDCEFIACGDDDGKCTILIRKGNGFEYQQITTQNVADASKDSYMSSVSTCCWLDANTVVVGTGVECDILHVLTIITMKNDMEFLQIICKYVNNIEYIGHAILDFCGFYVHRYSIQSAFTENAKVTAIKSLPDYSVAPGIFVASSWDYTACLCIPMNRK
eukprot:589185_1